jgi:hypothetical protein
MFIGSYAANPWLAFVFGVLSHFVLDAIPHDAKEAHDWHEKGDGMKKFLLEGLLDMWLFAVIIFFLQSNHLLYLNYSIIAGAVGAWLPDFLWAVPAELKIDCEPLKKYKIFHDKVHQLLLTNHYIPIKYAVPEQIIFLLIFLALYTHLGY